MLIKLFDRPFLTCDIIVGYSEPDIHLWLWSSYNGELVFVSGIKIMPGGESYEISQKNG